LRGRGPIAQPIAKRIPGKRETGVSQNLKKEGWWGSVAMKVSEIMNGTEAIVVRGGA